MSAASTRPTTQKTACFHCGLDCPDDSIRIDDKVFCCNGCKAVYLLLSENNLGRYYDENQTPGSRPDDGSPNDRFAFLDNENLAARLTDYVDDRQVRLRVRMPAIHCSSCVLLLENLYRIHPGVMFSRVNFVRKELTVALDPSKITLRQFAELLSSIGYEPDFLSTEQKSDTSKREVRRLYQRVGVAGFCFGNIMLFSFPDYLSVGGLDAGLLRSVFLYASAALSLPVLFFSSWGYLHSAFTSLKHKTINIDVPIALGMLTLFVRSWYEVTAGIGTGYFDSLSGLTFFLLVGRVFQQKTYERLSFDRDYRSYLPLAALKKTDTGTTPTPLGDLEIGDVLMIRNHEIIPADSVLVSGEAFIDYSFITGESEPQSVAPGERLFAGGRQMGSSIEVAVEKAVSQSHLTSLWNEAEPNAEREPHIDKLANTVASYFTFTVLAVAIAAGAYWYFVDPDRSMHAFTSVLIVACPCALALSSPFALGTAMRLMSNAGLFLKHVSFVERLADVRTIVFDKTGTLAYTEQSQVSFDGDRNLTPEESALISSLARHSTHPVSRSLVKQLGDSTRSVSDFKEQAGLGISGVVDGHQVRIGSRAWMDGDNPVVTEQYSRAGTWVSVDGHILGHFTLHDQLREGIETEIARLKQTHRLAIVSGDTERERSRLREILGDELLLAFQQSPHHKREAIREFQKSGDAVMMVGDGLNDAGALKVADVGVAVAENLAAFTPASDGILQAGKLVRLSRILELAKRSISVIWVCYALSFLYNLAGLGFAVTGQLSPIVAAILMPVSSITVVAVATGLTRWQGWRGGLR